MFDNDIPKVLERDLMKLDDFMHASVHRNVHSDVRIVLF